MTEDMGFESIQEISVEVDGQVHHGRFRETRDGIVVEYAGREARAPIGHDRPEDVAAELLRRMVRDGTA